VQAERRGLLHVTAPVGLWVVARVRACLIATRCGADTVCGGSSSSATAPRDARVPSSATPVSLSKSWNPVPLPLSV